MSNPPCKAALVIEGVWYQCDWPTDARGRHDGYDHTNADAVAAWACADPQKRGRHLGVVAGR